MDIKARQTEILESVAVRLFYLKDTSGNWDMMIKRLREPWYDEAELFIKRLSKLGVMLVDKEAGLPKLPVILTVEYVIFDDEDESVSFYDEEALDKAGYVKAYPLEVK